MKQLIKIVKGIYLNPLFFYSGAAAVGLFALSFVVELLFPLAQFVTLAFLVVTLIDTFMLFSKQMQIEVSRTTPNVFSLSDEHTITLDIANYSNQKLMAQVVDELPSQLQVRDFLLETELDAGERKRLTYTMRPTTRGLYQFGDVHLILKSKIGFIRRKITIPHQEPIKVFPSIIQMKKMEMQAFTSISTVSGVKKIRRIGHSYEFEQIKNYVRGDDFRSINWKATSRRNELMVNQYEDEKSQNVYCIIDKSRRMKMPFNGLSLLDYSINTSLALSNIALRKYDKAGLISFSDKLGSLIPSDRNKNQLQKILNALYNEKERFEEANFELLFNAVNRFIKTRSLLFLFTNFESFSSLKRVIPLLRRINKRHLLVVVFFENTEVTQFSEKTVEDIEGIYMNTIAKKAVLDKYQIVQTLKQYGIQSVITKPEESSLSTINKYLELKARGMI